MFHGSSAVAELNPHRQGNAIDQVNINLRPPRMPNYKLGGIPTHDSLGRHSSNMYVYMYTIIHCVFLWVSPTVDVMWAYLHILLLSLTVLHCGFDETCVLWVQCVSHCTVHAFVSHPPHRTQSQGMLLYMCSVFCLAAQETRSVACDLIMWACVPIWVLLLLFCLKHLYH